MFPIFFLKRTHWESREQKLSKKHIFLPNRTNFFKNKPIYIYRVLNALFFTVRSQVLPKLAVTKSSRRDGSGRNGD
jgi:hypothetical protein